MKISFKLLLFLGISLLLLIVFASFLLPSQGMVMESISISAPKDSIMKKLTQLSSYSKWFPWVFNEEGNMEYVDEQTFRFKGENEQKEFGEYQLGKQEGDSILAYTIRINEMPEYFGSYLLKGEGHSTFLAWEMKVKPGWKPWWRFYAAVMNRVMKPTMDSGLEKLKILCEQ